ncbi:DNA methylase N-4/N-6 domain protein [Caldithrix abyssi DSM 13497]|uniref:site-specific DNA-methyltransferase (adenine-specific) n=1 Tax=Caldithrix abyssi DSM 13497 TaxID=880073 RepID=H1XSW5_CALAY|nr:site-specific DNA-methyltransferase [Caldithrix abyssi]APF20294.1 adenine-specific DNA-methyltransferase [Caldithrix abyssi DSM 13497]EHO40342.1 DNA methylase N-4/N-6 domain protein [Caldithrix abyssi DSM 13497]
MEKTEKIFEQRMPDKIDILKKHFPHCFDKDGNFNIEKFNEEIKLNEINLSKESYGLEWLGKNYARVLATDPVRTLLKESEAFNQKEENRNSQNLLIKGDNLEVLKHLVNAYYEKIKMIYIDPPYNTGSDGFVYQDDRKFTVPQLMELAGIDEERAKRILDFVNSKSNSHSAWLTFMYPRLYIARQLLREDGVIFVSIDDNEVAQLKILMDEIFGEENFVIQFVWRSRLGKGGTADQVAQIHEYVLTYAKMKRNISFKRDVKISNGGRERLRQWGQGDSKEDRPSMYYPIPGPNGIEVYPIKPDGTYGRWRVGKEEMKKLISNGLVEFERREDGLFEAYKVIKKGHKTFSAVDSIISGENSSTTAGGSKEVKNLFNGIQCFDYPKPSRIISYLISLIECTDCIYLDFFAGSGTTGEAVMQLNAEDGGNRKYILVQLPEPIDPKKNKTAYDFVKDELGVEEPTIFEICKERLIRAAKKIKSEIDEKIKAKEKEIKELESQLNFGDNEEKIASLEQEIENLKNQDLGFKIFETIPLWKDYLQENDKLTEQTSLFDEGKLTEDDIKSLLITWQVYDGIELTEKPHEIDINGYKTYYIDCNLYLLYKGWKTNHLKALLEKIDTDKNFNPIKIILFGYNFDSKSLREINENIKSYSNKKQIDIDVITRY